MYDGDSDSDNTTAALLHEAYTKQSVQQLGGRIPSQDPSLLPLNL